MFLIIDVFVISCLLVRRFILSLHPSPVTTPTIPHLSRLFFLQLNNVSPRYLTNIIITLAQYSHVYPYICDIVAHWSLNVKQHSLPFIVLDE